MRRYKYYLSVSTKTVNRAQPQPWLNLTCDGWAWLWGFMSPWLLESSIRMFAITAFCAYWSFHFNMLVSFYFIYPMCAFMRRLLSFWSLAAVPSCRYLGIICGRKRRNFFRFGAYLFCVLMSSQSIIYSIGLYAGKYALTATHLYQVFTAARSRHPLGLHSRK